VSTVLLDTHVVHWWSAQRQQVSRAAVRAIERADELAVASITWYELAWMVEHERITIPIPVRAWLKGLSESVVTVPATVAIAVSAAQLPRSFPSDPADRMIYATAIEHGWQLVTRDERMHAYAGPRNVTIW
jgi:PIN domain nuclease of toxin-antitoxin system